jgi:glycosyltransferase involved in cell wall biosynthesis
MGTGLEKGKAHVASASNDKRIVFVLPKTTEFGGLERHLLDLLRRLPESRLQPFLVCFDQDIISERMEGEQLSQVVVKCEKAPTTVREWIRVIRNAKPDILVFCYSWIEAFPWQAPVAAFLAGVHRRYSIQHLIPTPPPPPERGRSPRNLLRRFIGKRARYLLGLRIPGHLSTKTICVSDAVRNALVNLYRFPARKTITVQNGVSTSTFAPSKRDGADLRAKFGIGPGEFVLVCAARLAEAKGVDILLQAVAQVFKQGTPCKCFIVGDGPLRAQLMGQANSLGLSGQVFFEGFQKDVRPYLQAASAFILTSHLEGLPLSVLEAMACGVPCIVTNVGGSAEAVKHQEVGLVIPPASVEAATNAILQLATHPDELAQMAGRTRERVCTSFDIEVKMGELSRVLLS